jgi:hypothetical protein
MLKKTIFIFSLCTFAITIFMVMIANGEEVIFPQDVELPQVQFVPNPEDTIAYDNPPPINPLFPGNPAYWAVRFTPTDYCTVKAGYVSAELISGAPDCSLFVWDDAGGQPGLLVGGTPIHFIPSGYPTFDRINLLSTYVDSNDFWIGYFIPFAGANWANALSDSVDGPIRSYFSPDRFFWTDLPSMGLSGDLLIRAIVECPRPATPDIAMDSILAPPDTVACLDTVAVSARVCNVGDTTFTFDVGAIIPGLYGDTITGVTLSPPACTTLTFADWVVPNSHGACSDVIFKIITTDSVPSNDSLSTVSCAYCPVFPDVEVNVILAPPDTVACLDTVSVSALICNVGDTMVTFDVEAIIPGIYGDTVTVVSLDSFQCTVANFADWIVPNNDGQCYDLTIRTLLLGDIDNSNDTLTKTSCASCPINPDIAVDSILSPPDTVVCLNPAPVSARVCNVGDTTLTFDVEASIPGLYADTITVVDLMPDSCSTLTFANWVVPDSHGVCFDVKFEILITDSDPSNDTLSTSSCAFCPPGFRDIGVSSLDNPPDTVYADSLYPVEVTLINYGDSTETTFPLTINIGPYSDVNIVSAISPGETLQVSFDSMSVPSDCDTSYMAKVEHLLTDDNDSNDSLVTWIYTICPPPLRDVGAISIDNPPDTVYADSTVPVAASVYNYGAFTETNFVFSIDIGAYSDARIISTLAPQETLQVIFDSMTVPTACDTTYMAIAKTFLSGDMNTSNDSFAQGVYAICDTVGISEEPSPEIPNYFALLQSRPNPFSSSTMILYHLPRDTHVSLDIYDTAGRLIRTLAAGVEEAGVKKIHWDGRDDLGVKVNSGVYFYKYQALRGDGKDVFTQTRKLILLR